MAPFWAVDPMIAAGAKTNRWTFALVLHVARVPASENPIRATERAGITVEGRNPMASLIGRIASFARSPQGKRLVSKAQQFASKPENRRKIAELRTRLAKKA
jgi:hypothetical protein